MNTTASGWTIAYRKPTGRVFHRIDLALTWQQACDLYGHVAAVMGNGYDVWYVPNATLEQDGLHPEDIGNILVPSGKRVRIVDNGELPFPARTVTYPDAYGRTVTATFIREECNTDGKPNGIALVELPRRRRTHVGMVRLSS